jgi:hypothetical protein
MCPDGAFPLKADEIGKEVFYNLSVYDQPVKTTIFRGGLEFDYYADKLCAGSVHPDQPNVPLIQELIGGNACILPTLFKGTGQFPNAEPTITRTDLVLDSPEAAWHTLDMSLAIHSKVALDRCGAANGIPIFIEGGFRKNAVYSAFLSTLYPESEVCLTNLENATSFGAAILGKAAIESIDPKKTRDLFQIETEIVDKLELNNISDYLDYFIHSAT